MNEQSEQLADGPIKATRKASIPGGKKRERMYDRVRLQGFWPMYAAFVVLCLRPPFAEEHAALAWLRTSGAALAFAGVAMRTWSLGYLLKKEELATAGPYGRTRNPLYVGTWLIGSGFALLTAWPFNLILLVVYNVLFFVVYRGVIKIEEEVLESIYGEPYDRYRENVPRFLPALRPWRVGDVSRFSLGRAFHNRAWEPLLGVVLLLLLQVLAWGLAWPLLRGGALADVWAAFVGGAWLGI